MKDLKAEKNIDLSIAYESGFESNIIINIKEYQGLYNYIISCFSILINVIVNNPSHINPCFSYFGYVYTLNKK